MKSVESLIAQIKSGHLVKEQEESNGRIQEILGNILDKTKNSEIFELFEDEKKKSEGDNKTEVSSRNLDFMSETEAESARYLASMSNNNMSLSLDLKAESSEAFKTNRELTTTQALSESEKLLSTIRSHMSSYHAELDAYLASLSPQVTNEDVICVQAEKSTLNQRPTFQPRNLVSLDHSGKKEVEEKALEEKYARNLHMFCMLEEKRREAMLLPQELINVTRKYHTRNKFEKVNIFF